VTNVERPRLLVTPPFSSPEGRGRAAPPTLVTCMVPGEIPGRRRRSFVRDAGRTQSSGGHRCEVETKRHQNTT
jgi:hypothetical protein